MTSARPLDSIETHLLFVLLDSNLPTGGFVSSSGLESYAKHGFLSPTPTYGPSATTPFHLTSNLHHPLGAGAAIGAAGPSRGPSLGQGGMAKAITRFAEAEVENYATSTGPFVRDAWEVVDSALRPNGWCGTCRKGKHRAAPPVSVSNRVQGNEDDVAADTEDLVAAALEQILALDQHHEACLLSHVSRRSSKAQGVAMLTLFSRGLSRPFDTAAPFNPSRSLDATRADVPNGTTPTTLDTGPDGDDEETRQTRENMAREIIDGYKRLVRKGTAPGHLAVCWGAMSSALGLSQDRAMHLHLFLHARSLLSSAVRLNLIGPYLSSQLLLHPFQTIIDKPLSSIASTGTIEWCHCAEPNATCAPGGHGGLDEGEGGDGFWAWTKEAQSGAATTWPLGEVLMARHDLQHSRIFNS